MATNQASSTSRSKTITKFGIFGGALAALLLLRSRGKKRPSDQTSRRTGDQGAAGGHLPKSAPCSDEDWEQFREQGKAVIDFVADYFQNQLASLPVKSRVSPGYMAQTPLGTDPSRILSEDGGEIRDLLEDVQQYIVPGVTHWQHPNFFAYFPANTSPPSLCGDLLSGMFNCVAFSWVASPAATELETMVMDQLATFIGLPEAFQSKTKGGGVIQGSASEATLVALLSARQKVRERLPADADPSTVEPVLARIVVYASEQAHSSVKKAAMIAGIPMHHFRAIEASKSTDFSMNPAALENQMEKDISADLIPAICIATVGTTGVGAVDPLGSIGRVRGLD